MLVLSRKTGEEIVIGQDIRVTVVDVKGGKVKIGIQAPDDVAIFRSELRDWVAPAPDTRRPTARPYERRPKPQPEKTEQTELPAARAS
jgi:carbon storage regulator